MEQKLQLKAFQQISHLNARGTLINHRGEMSIVQK